MKIPFLSSLFANPHEKEPTPDARPFRRWQIALLIGSAGTVFAFAWISMSAKKDSEPAQEPTQVKHFSLTANTERDSFYTRFDARVSTLNQQIQTLSATVEKQQTERAALTSQIERLSDALNTLTQKAESDASAREKWEKSMETRFTLTGDAPVSQEGEESRSELRNRLGVEKNAGFQGDDYRYSERGGYVSPAASLSGSATSTASGFARESETHTSGHLTELRLTDERLNATAELNRTSTRTGAPVRQGEGKAAARTPAFGPTPYLLPDTPLALNRAMGVEGYIAAGSFAPATLLTGAYVMTGASASNMPIPVLLRLVNTAILPNEFQAEVKGCFVTGAATGDLSSERILVRLDRLACTREDGSQLDVSVKGYVVGEDGKVGVRGKLITHSGQAIAAAISMGLLSGVGNAITLTSESTTTSSLGFQTTEVRDAWRHGLGKGLSGAMDRIVDYYLKIADQIFPVLECASGRQVEVVFAQGVLLSNPDAAPVNANSASRAKSAAER